MTLFLCVWHKIFPQSFHVLLFFFNTYTRLNGIDAKNTHQVQKIHNSIVKVQCKHLEGKRYQVAILINIHNRKHNKFSQRLKRWKNNFFLSLRKKSYSRNEWAKKIESQSCATWLLCYEKVTWKCIFYSLLSCSSYFC